MVKKIVVFYFCCWYSMCSMGQHIAPPSQYRMMYNSVSPSIVGNGEKVDVSLIYRDQYMGFEGGPKTFFLSSGMPLEIGNTKSGVGFFVVSDNIGYYNKVDFKALYSYKVKMDTNGEYLSLGMAIGAVSYGLKPPSEWGNMGGDVAIPSKTEEGNTFFDMGLGVDYTRGDLFVSLGIMNVTAPKITKIENSVRLTPSVNVSGEYLWRLTSLKNTTLKAYSLAVFNSIIPSMIVGGELGYKKMFGGMSYRIGESLGVNFGMGFFKDAMFGVMYEYPLNKMFGYSSGSFELFLKYSFSASWRKKDVIYKSLRFL